MASLVAIAGDVHGELGALVALLRRFERAFGARLDLALQVGDLEPHRDERDLATCTTPERYRRVGDFPRYARGEARLPCELVFIGGNHEPYGRLEEMRDGGEVAPGVTYLGRAGVVERLGLRIGGLSGIFSPNHSERATRPSREQCERRWKLATYYTREDVARLLTLAPIDLLLLHEWPEGLLAPGHASVLPTAARGERVGGPPARVVVERLAPPLVFCGHMHVAYARELELECGARVSVHALANVARGAESVAFARVEGKRVDVLPPLGEIEALGSII